MKKIIIIFIICCCFFGICIISSSPYRELRPYAFSNITNSGKNKAKLEFNNKNIILIESNNDIEPFYIDQRPVTIEEYKQYTAPSSNMTYHYRDSYAKYISFFWYSELPVTFVLWSEARQYCQALGGDLPTEKQWGLAADSQSDGRDYAWGNDFPSLARANFDGYYQSQVPAGWLPKGASGLGVLDLNGNVREWILDENPDNITENGLKGASFQDSFSSGKNDSIFYHDPKSSGFNRGFRCVYPYTIIDNH